MLPDLWRMADRRVRPRGATPPPPAGIDATLAAVLAGVAHHLELDAWFHRAPVFIEGEKLAAESLRASGIQASRMGMLAHVIWEMCLDGALLRREGLEPVIAVLRKGFAETEDARRRAVEILYFEQVEREPGARDAFDARLRRLCDEVVRGPWIEGYRDPVGLAVRVAGIRARLGMEALSAEDHERLVVALGPVAVAADEGLVRVLADRGGR